MLLWKEGVYSNLGHLASCYVVGRAEVRAIIRCYAWLTGAAAWVAVDYGAGSEVFYPEVEC